MQVRADRISARAEPLANGRVRFWFQPDEVERFRTERRIEPNRSQFDIRDAQILDSEARIRDLEVQVADLTAQLAATATISELRAEMIVTLKEQIELLSASTRTEADGPGAHG